MQPSSIILQRMLRIVTAEHDSFETAFNKALAHCPFAIMSSLHATYQHHYLQHNFNNLSALIFQGDTCVGVITLSSHETDDHIVVGGFGNPGFIYSPLYFERDNDLLRQFNNVTTKYINQKLATLSTDKPILLHIGQKDLSCGLDPLSDIAFERGANPQVHFNRIVDLTLPIEQLKQGVRKSYKSLINWGLKNLDLQVYDTNNINQKPFSALRQLHFEAAGGRTRPDITWDCQYSMIQAGFNFLVVGTLDHKPVTAALFSHNQPYCYYGVSASNRALFDKPLSHGVIWAAIEHAKSKGIKHFDLGRQFNLNYPNQKEYNISKFKRGFGGIDKPSLTFRHELTDTT